jgi:hypothetical protein
MEVVLIQKFGGKSKGTKLTLTQSHGSALIKKGVAELPKTEKVAVLKEDKAPKKAKEPKETKE